MARFVLDQNFPWYVTPLEWPPGIQIDRLADVDRRLTAGYDDWEVLLELGDRGDVDGFISNDADMLELPREMVALSSTRLVLVVTDGVGHDPLRATGLVMVYLGQIAKQLTGKPAFYRLRPGALGQFRKTPGQQIDDLAKRQVEPANQLVSRERRLIDRDRRRPQS